MMIGSFLVQAILFLAPWPIRRRALCTLFGMKIAPSARIGFSFIDCAQTILGERSWIGHLNVVKGLATLSLGEHARLGNGNWITGYRGETPHFRLEQDRTSALVIGDHSAITNRHLIDCTDMIKVGRFTTIAGWGSQILTHAIDLPLGRQSCSPVIVGDYCFIGTRSVILKGAKFPDKSVLGPGSVLTGEANEEGWLYGGVPARPIKAMVTNQGYFVRRTGFVT